jgi:hypothetical protein
MVGMYLRGVILSSAGGVVGAERQLGRMIPSHCAADETSCVSTWCLTKVFTANPEGAARICR